MLSFEDCEIARGSFVLRADFTVPRGEIVAVIGPSGSGKSTLLEAVAGFCPLRRGALRWQGQDLTQAPPTARPVAMLFQDGNLFPHLSAAQNVALALRVRGRLSAAERTQVEEALARVGLAGYGARKPSELSGGQQSRAALARVLLQGRDILLLDEPFAALGPALRDEMLDLVADLAREAGTTVLMVSHAPGDAARIAALTSVVADGQAQAPQPTAMVLADPPAALRAYLGESPRKW